MARYKTGVMLLDCGCVTADRGPLTNPACRLHGQPPATPRRRRVWPRRARRLAPWRRR